MIIPVVTLLKFTVKKNLLTMAHIIKISATERMADITVKSSAFNAPNLNKSGYKIAPKSKDNEMPNK